MRPATAALLTIWLAACGHSPVPSAVTVPVCPIVQPWTREEMLALAAALEWLSNFNGPEAAHVDALARAENERRNLRDQAQACRDASNAWGNP